MAIKNTGACIILTLIGAVFFTIALPTYLCGCHPVVQPNCLRFDIEMSQVESYRVDKKTCSECVAWTTTCTTSSDDEESCTTQCALYYDYDCYFSYAIMNTNSSYTCEISVATSTSSDDALQSARDKYPLGQTLELYIDKNTHDCLTESNVEALAITGLVFLCLTGVTLVLAVVSVVRANVRNCHMTRS